MPVKELVAPQNIVVFTRYFDGQLWYEVMDASQDLARPLGFEFPVPVSEAGTATFLAEDKAMLFMRYIRKHLKMLEEAKAGTGVAT